MAPRAPGPIVLPPPPALKSQIIFTKLRKQFNSQKMSKFRQLNSKFQYLISKEYSSFWPGGVRGGVGLYIGNTGKTSKNVPDIKSLPLHLLRFIQFIL